MDFIYIILTISRKRFVSFIHRLLTVLTFLGLSLRLKPRKVYVSVPSIHFFPRVPCRPQFTHSTHSSRTELFLRPEDTRRTLHLSKQRAVNTSKDNPGRLETAPSRHSRPRTRFGNHAATPQHLAAMDNKNETIRGSRTLATSVLRAPTSC